MPIRSLLKLISRINSGSLFAPRNVIFAISYHPQLRSIVISDGAGVTLPKFEVYRLAQGSREVFSLAQEASSRVKQYL